MTPIHTIFDYNSGKMTVDDNDVASGEELANRFLAGSGVSNVYRNQIIVTIVVSLLSAMGSAYIFVSMVIDARRRRKPQRTFDRLLMCLCVADFVSSLSYFLGSWAIPVNPPAGYEEVLGKPGYWNVIFPQAAGNTGTCT